MRATAFRFGQNLVNEEMSQRNVKYVVSVVHRQQTLGDEEMYQRNVKYIVGVVDRHVQDA